MVACGGGNNSSSGGSGSGYSVLYSFGKGDSPNGGLIQGSDGNLYGTTAEGGAQIAGTVYMVTSAGVESVLHTFGSGSDGRNPNALIQGSDGNFYGTTRGGGDSVANSGGTVFTLTPAGTETVLHSFGSGSDGLYPGGLIQGRDGNLYGATDEGGTNGTGTVFMVTPAGTETVLLEKSVYDLIQVSDGNFYGIAGSDGTLNNEGTFSMLTPTGTETDLYTFSLAHDGGSPASLIQGSDGNFYGITSGFSAINPANDNLINHGSVFKLTPMGVETVLHHFATNTDGAYPTSLIQGSDGNFYGTTISGGANGNGTVFMVTPAGTYSVLYSFGPGDSGAPGVDVWNPPFIIQGSDGNFYGETSAGGGENDAGGIFMVTPAGIETVLHSFGTGSDGQGPNLDLFEGRGGIFYGTTSLGGTNGNGTVFKF